MSFNNTQGSANENLPHDSRATALLAVFWSSVTFSALFLAVRVYGKKRTKRGLWWDDYIALASWVSFAIFISIETYRVVELKFGARDWDIAPENISLAATVAAGSYPFLLLAIMGSKTSFAITLLRLTTEWMRWGVWFLIITTNVFLGFSIIIYYIQCTPVQALWDSNVKGKCWDRNIAMNYHIFSGAWSSFVDLALVFLALKLILSMRLLGREKWGVAIAMSMGVFAAAASIIKTVQLHLLASPSTYDAAPVMYWGPIEIATTLIAASIPALRLLVQDIRRLAPRDQETNEATNSMAQGQYDVEFLYIARLSSDAGGENSTPLAAGRGRETAGDGSETCRHRDAEKGKGPNSTHVEVA
ncbi:hypothetical protein FOMA001_g17778 [Fusarium oxysporum f. sp. matthiolae]|nr:hypothetical protein FOMA001_g17778 [Fusarium oxysporum f. sp. matthiolae]